MNLSEARDMLLSAYNDVGCYFHRLPMEDDDFIDGMAWNGILLGAARIAGDAELGVKAFRYLDILTRVGPTPFSARNFSDHCVDSAKWLPSPNINGLWYYAREQSMAGPFGVIFANQCGGSQVAIPETLVKMKAHALCVLGLVFGVLARQFPYFRQHLNTVFTAHLICKRKPAFTMLWATEENPYFSYIAGKKITVSYPDVYRTTSMEERVEENVVPLANAKPSAWIFRRDPFVRYILNGAPFGRAYVPIWQVVGEYLQQSL